MGIRSQIYGDTLPVEASTTIRCETRVNYDNIFLDLVPSISENTVIKKMLKENYLRHFLKN